jgi:PRC-barrel domain
MQSKTRWCPPQSDVELMTEKQILGFKSAPRLEQVGYKHSERVQDRKHRSQWCDDSASRRESTPDGIFGKDRWPLIVDGFLNRVFEAADRILNLASGLLRLAFGFELGVAGLPDIIWFASKSLNNSLVSCNLSVLTLRRVLTGMNRPWRILMKKTMLLASAAMIGIAVLATHANAQGVPQSVEITKVDVQKVAAGYRASKVVGSSVVNDANETIGKIDDLLVTRDGKEPYVVLSVGGFLGMGTRMVVIRYDSLKFADNKIVLPGGTKDGLKMLPAFQYSKEWLSGVPVATSYGI